MRRSRGSVEFQYPVRQLDQGMAKVECHHVNRALHRARGVIGNIVVLKSISAQRAELRNLIHPPRGPSRVEISLDPPIGPDPHRAIRRPFDLPGTTRFRHLPQPIAIQQIERTHSAVLYPDRSIGIPCGAAGIGFDKAIRRIPETPWRGRLRGSAGRQCQPKQHTRCITLNRTGQGSFRVPEELSADTNVNFREQMKKTG